MSNDLDCFNARSLISAGLDQRMTSKVCVTDLTQIYEVHVGFRDHINSFKLVVQFARLLTAPAAHAIARNV